MVLLLFINYIYQSDKTYEIFLSVSIHLHTLYYNNTFGLGYYIATNAKSLRVSQYIAFVSFMTYMVFIYHGYL